MPIKVRIRFKVALLLPFLIFCTKAGENLEIRRKIFVKVDTVKFGKLRKTSKVWCMVKPSDVFFVVSDVEGVVSHIFYRDGDFVKKGDTLARIYRGPNFTYIPVISPENGRLEKLEVEKGSPVGKGTVIAVLSKGGLKVDLFIPLKIYRSIHPYGEFLLNGSKGIITYVSRLPEENPLSYKAEGKISGYVQPGPYICEVVLESSDSVMYVPEKSIRDSFIFVVRGGKVIKTKVKPVFSDGKGNIGIVSGVDRGDTIVVLGVEMLEDTSEVVF